MIFRVTAAFICVPFSKFSSVGRRIGRVVDSLEARFEVDKSVGFVGVLRVRGQFVVLFADVASAGRRTVTIC